jgi:hypothetical protein
LGGAAIGALLGIAGFQLSSGLREPEREPEPRAEQVQPPRASKSEGPLASEPAPKKPKAVRKEAARDAGVAKAPRAVASDAGAKALGDAGDEVLPP